MANSFSVDIVRSSALSMAQELVLARAANALHRHAPALKQRLAGLLVANYHWDEAITELKGIIADDPGFLWCEALCQSYLARKTEADTRQAQVAAYRALEAAASDEQRGRALALLGKTYIRLNDAAAAERTLLAALDADPHHRDAYKRLSELYLRQLRSDDILVLADRLSTYGVRHSRLFASRTLAYAQAGYDEAARASVNLEAFLYRTHLPPPQGWTDIAAFNSALCAEILALSTAHDNCERSAARDARRIDEPTNGPHTLVAALQQQIVRAIDQHAMAVGHIDHPWARAKPQRGKLHSWCVMTAGRGFEDWHAHQYGWLSGAYYVAVPERVTSGDDPAGCLAFGLPDDLIGADHARRYGQHIERVERGLLMLWPSHAYHRTFVCPSPELRLCFAFDVWPV